jgi:hypothetical protein
VLANLGTGWAAIAQDSCTVRRICRGCVWVSGIAARSRAIDPLWSGILDLPAAFAGTVESRILECAGAAARAAGAHENQHQHDRVVAESRELRRH